MKVLFLTLLLGLVCSAEEEEAEQSVSTLSGKWIPVFTATRNLARLDKKVSSRVYLCHLVFDEKQGTIDFDIYVEVDGEWRIIHITGKRQDDRIYISDSEWIKEIIVTDVSDTVRIVCFVYVDEQGQEIRFVEILVNIDEKALAILKDLKGVDENCIAKLFGIGICPPCGYIFQQLLFSVEEKKERIEANKNFGFQLNMKESLRPDTCSSPWNQDQ